MDPTRRNFLKFLSIVAGSTVIPADKLLARTSISPAKELEEVEEEFDIDDVELFASVSSSYGPEDD